MEMVVAHPSVNTWGQQHRHMMSSRLHTTLGKHVVSFNSITLTHIHVPYPNTKIKLTYLLIPWSKVLLKKLTRFRLVKKFPAFYGTRRFITAFTSARHLSPSWASSIQSIPPHPYQYYPPIYVWVYQVVSFPQVSPPKPSIRLSCPPYVLNAPPISLFSF